MAADEPGKETLNPIAAVIIWGLITSIVAVSIVRPALFWTVGIGNAKLIVGENHPLTEGELSGPVRL